MRDSEIDSVLFFRHAINHHHKTVDWHYNAATVHPRFHLL